MLHNRGIIQLKGSWTQWNGTKASREKMSHHVANMSHEPESNCILKNTDKSSRLISNRTTLLCEKWPLLQIPWSPTIEVSSLTTHWHRSVDARQWILLELLLLLPPLPVLGEYTYEQVLSDQWRLITGFELPASRSTSVERSDYVNRSFSSSSEVCLSLGDQQRFSFLSQHSATASTDLRLQSHDLESFVEYNLSLRRRKTE